MKKSVSLFTKLTALALVLVLASSFLFSCTRSIASRYRSYERKETEPYNYELTEYVSVPEYLGVEVPDLDGYEPTSEEIKNEQMRKLAYFSEEESVNEPAEYYDLIDADYTTTVDGAEYTALCSYVDNSRRSFMLGIGYLGLDIFDEEIKGMMPGDTKTINFTFPEPYVRDILYSGKEGEMTITIDKVRRLDFKEYNDDFVGQYLGGESVDDYDSEIVESLKNDRSHYLDNYDCELAYQFVSSQSKVKDLPSKEFRQVLSETYDSYVKKADSEGVTILEYIQKLGFESEDEFFDYYVEPEAENRVENEMILYVIARCENITVSDGDYESALKELGNGYELTDLADCKQLAAETYGSETEFRERVLFQRVYEFLGENSVKIDPGEYYKNLHDGKYDVDPDETVGMSGTDIALIVVICVFGAILIAFIVILVIFLAKRRKIKAQQAEEARIQAEIEEKRRLRKEAEAEKKRLKEEKRAAYKKQ